MPPTGTKSQVLAPVETTARYQQMVRGLSHSRYFWASSLYCSHFSSFHLSTLSSGVLGSAGSRCGPRRQPLRAAPAAAWVQEFGHRPPPLRGARAVPGPASAWNAHSETAAAAQSAVARPWLSHWERDATESHRSSTTPPWKSSDST